MASKCARSGLSLVELAVVLGILGLLLALLLPAVMSSREASRRVSCTSNLKQLGLALHSYEAACGSFPPLTFRWSPQFQMLPYMEQAALHAQMTRRNARFQQILDSVHLPIFHCPSDPLNPSPTRSTNYAVNIGTGTFAPDHFNGMFGTGRDGFGRGAVRAADVSDGLSNTAAMSELLVGGKAFTEERRRLWDIGRPWDRGGPAPLVDDFADDCRSLETDSSDAVLRDLRGMNWFAGVESVVYDHVLTPNVRSCVYSSPPRRFVPFAGAYNAVAQHEGVNVLLADGAVRAVTTSIDRAAWRSLGSRSGAD